MQTLPAPRQMTSSALRCWPTTPQMVKATPERDGASVNPAEGTVSINATAPWPSPGAQRERAGGDQHQRRCGHGHDSVTVSIG
jgi:hypothetical protein